jgi:hypothetical protein
MWRSLVSKMVANAGCIKPPPTRGRKTKVFICLAAMASSSPPSAARRRRGNPSDDTGDVQGVSNIATFNTWQLYEAWIKQNLFDNRLSVLFGLYDLNSEFAVIQSEQVFINSSHGIDLTLAASGRNGPSSFPTTSVLYESSLNPSHGFMSRAGYSTVSREKGASKHSHQANITNLCKRINWLRWSCIAYTSRTRRANFLAYPCPQELELRPGTSERFFLYGGIS